MGDWMLSLQNKITYLLEQGKFIFVYSGDKDFICNWKGGEAWTNAASWSQQESFQVAPYLSWGPADAPYGEYKMIDNLAFVKVYNAGHMVPMNQPEAALFMFEKFLVDWKNATNVVIQ